MSTLGRVHNWDIALAEYAAALLGQPYEWGRTDCVSCWRGGQAAMRGCEPADICPEIGTWTAPAAAGRARARWLHPEADLTLVGLQRVAPTHLQSGDLLLVTGPDDEYPQAYLVIGGMVLAATPDAGVTSQPLASVLGGDVLAAGWRLP